MSEMTSRPAPSPITQPVTIDRKGSWGFELPSRWKLERFLGTGGQSEVWLARDAQVDQLVAIKVFPPDLTDEALERLKREVRLGRTLEHPGLVRVFELIEAEGRLAMAMAWLPGGSAAQRLAEVGPLPFDEVLRIGEDLMAALAYLHERRIVHRDVKPSNVLLEDDGHCRLGDLGLVLGLDDVDRLTRTAMTVGTPTYMSPEQIKGARVTPASDLYSLGVTLFQLVTARPPFRGASDFEIARQQLQEPAPDPRRFRPDCPRWLARFILRLLEKRPADRWPDAAAARVVFASQRVPRSLRLRRQLLATAAMLAALGVGVFAARRWGPGPTRASPPVAIEANGRLVRALDASGTEVWQRMLAAPVVQVEHGDLDGDGRPDTVVVSNAPRSEDRDTRSAPSEVLAITADGTVLSQARVDRLIGQWPWAFPPDTVSRATLVDLDRDGRDEILLSSSHRVHFPATLHVFWPRQGSWMQVLQHGGVIYDVTALPDSARPRLRFFAFANVLAMNAVAGELELQIPGATGNLPQTWQSGVFGEGPGVRVTWYTLLGERRPGERNRLESIVAGADGSSLVSPGGVPERLDRFGNPASSSNWGIDLGAARTAFLVRAGQMVSKGHNAGAEAAADEEKAIRAEYSGLLREPPYLQVLALMGAEAAAAGGDRAAALGRLMAIEEAWRLEAVWYRHANLLAIEGRLAEAEALLRELLRSYRTPAAHYDGLVLLLRVETDRRQEAAIRDLLASAVASWPKPAYLAVPARVNLWWDRATEVDGHAVSSDRAPDGEAIACLVRWRQGRSRPEDVEAMRRAIEINPEAADEGQLALAATLSALGRHREALAIFPVLENSLGSAARLDFRARQLLDLVEAIHARATLAAGDAVAARRRAAALAVRLRPGLLPARIVAEVLASAPQ